MSESERNPKERYWRLGLPIAAAVIGVLLLLWGSFSGSEASKSSAEVTENHPSERSAELFALETEERIVRLCASVEGAENVCAAVSLAGGYRAVYALNSQISESSHRQEMVLLGNGASEQAVLIGYENPEIVGIGIVCDGGNDPLVRQQIIFLISATFDIATNKIYVTGS